MFSNKGPQFEKRPRGEHSSHIRLSDLYRVLIAVAVFLSVFGFIKLSQYFSIYYGPSFPLILEPIGISHAAVFLVGYEMLFPIALAWLAAGLAVPGYDITHVLIFTFAFTLQAFVGAFSLRKLKFSGTMETAREVLLLVGSALLLPLVGLSVIIVYQLLTDTVIISSLLLFGRIWLGGTMGITVLTPVVITWTLPEYGPLRLQELFETVTALWALALVTYVITWTTILQTYTFFALYAFFAILVWIALRLRPRFIKTAMFVISIISISNALIAEPKQAAGMELYSYELFIILIAPIFYFVTSLTTERRLTLLRVQRHEHEVEQLNLRLNRLDETRKDFIATLAHEIRTPLSIILSSAELIRLDIGNRKPAALENIATIEETVHLMTRLTEDLQDTSRLLHNQFQLRRERVQLSKLFTDSTAAVDEFYKEKGHTLSVSLPEQAIELVVDSMRFKQILVNLLINAAKYTNEGGTIRMSASLSRQKKLRIVVEDNGLGIDPSMLKEIFEPFTRIKVHRSQADGLGLGLSLVKQLTEAHGGTVIAESEGLGKGSKFIVTLPVLQ